MYRKYRILSLLAATVVVAGCYTDELRQMHEELESLEDEKIASLQEQASSVGTSISDLNTLSSLLEEYMTSLEESSEQVDNQLSEAKQTLDSFKETVSEEISESAGNYAKQIEALNSALEAELAAAKALIPGLEESDESIRQKISDLEEYIKSGIFAGKTWTEGTFATLDRQNELIAEIENIRAQIEQLNSSSEQINEKLKKMIEDAFKEFRDKYTGEIASKSEELTQYYTSALEKMNTDFGQSNAKIILEAVEQSETSVMEWINGKLDDYLTVEAASAKIAAFDLILGMVPDTTSLQDEINAAAKAIQDAASSVQEAYGNAITSAIEEHEGKITKMSSDSIAYLKTKVLEPLATRVGNISTDVQKLWEEANGLETKVKSAEDQVAAIQATLAVLKTLDKTLEEYIESVKDELSRTDDDNNKLLCDMLDKLGALLSSKDSTSLQSQITALKEYIGEIPSGENDMASWIKTSIQTLNAQFDTYALLSTVNEYFSQISSTLDSHRGSILTLESKIVSLLNNSENTIKGWLEEKLASYTDAAATDGILSALEQEIKELFAGGDQTLNTNYNALVEKFSALKATLKTEYETAITNAIAQHDGLITSEIQSALSKLDADITALESDVTGMQAEITTLRGNISTFSGDISTLKSSLQTYLAFFNVEGYETLAALISDLWDKLEALDTTYANKAEFDSLYTYVQGDLSVQAGKVQGLITRLQAVNNRIDKFDAFLTEYSLDSAGLKDMITVITNKVDSLKNEVNGTGALDQSLQGQISKIDSIFYGKGKTPDNPDKNSLMGWVNRLSDLLVLNQLRSITYVPRNIDKYEELSFDGTSTYSASFYFVLRPASIVRILNKDNLKLKFTPTLTKAGAAYEFEQTSITTGTDGVLYIEVKESRSTYTEMLKSGASAALFADIKDDYGDVVSSFSSPYVPLKIVGNGDIHVEKTSLLFPASGGEMKITISAVDPFWLMRGNQGYIPTDYIAYSSYTPESWIHVSPEENVDDMEIGDIRPCYKGSVELTIKVDCNNSSTSRSDDLTFSVIRTKNNGDKIVVHIQQEGNTIRSSLGTEGDHFENNKISFTLINEDRDHPYVYLSKRELVSSILTSGYAIGVQYETETDPVDFPETPSTAIMFPESNRIQVIVDASNFTLDFNNFDFNSLTFSTPIEFTTIAGPSDDAEVGSKLSFEVGKGLFNFWDKDIK